MSYEMCLEKAGAKVLAFHEFGSYQGEWYALVEYQGERGWIEGSYGSCSGCDAFEAEFGFECCDKGHFYKDSNCSACDALYTEIDKRYAEFGRTYLETILSYDLQLENMQRLIDQDNWAKYEYQEIYDWMKSVQL